MALRPRHSPLIQASYWCLSRLMAAVCGHGAAGAKDLYCREMPPPDVIARLAATPTIDLTTYGRRSGQPSRIEIWWFYVAERFIITGTPGRRDWYANVLANPSVVIHAPIGDFPANARVVDEPAFRTAVFTQPQIGWYRTQSELDELVRLAPMIEILLD